MKLFKLFTKQQTAKPVRNLSERVVVKNYYNQYKLDIDNWEKAKLRAENIHRHRYDNLQVIYSKTSNHPQISSLMKRITLELQSAEYTFTDEIKKTQWFEQLIKYYVESLFYGYSVISVTSTDKETGKILEIKNVNRQHINPIDREFIADLSNDKTEVYKEDKWLFENYTDDENHFGLFDNLIYNVILYNYTKANLCELLDRYSTPTKVLKSNNNLGIDVNDNDDLRSKLQELGRNGSIILDPSLDFEFKNGLNVKAEEFIKTLQEINSDISKVLLGSVIGEASQGGSRSKEEVGERIQNTFIQGYKTGFTNWVNNHVVPRLRAIGYSISDDELFKYNEKVDTDRILNIINALKGTGKQLSNDFLERTLNIELDDQEVIEEDQTGSGATD